MMMPDRKTLIKNFTLGFLPLLVFIIADEAFGLTTGLIVAVAFGVGQALLIYFREKRLDKFVLFDTGLIITLGLISFLLHSDIFIKIKPGLVELILVILLGITAFSSNPLLIRLSGRYIKGWEFSEEQIQHMRVVMKHMFYIFSIHTILIFISAFSMSNEAWLFISGGLFYILMGAIVVGEFARARWHQYRLGKRYSGEEWFDIVTPEGKVIGKAPRSAVHGNPQLLHPVVHVHILNSRGEIYLQKRAHNKDIQPDRWDTAIGGHVLSGESIEHALNREAEEELGISFGKYQPLFRYVMRNEVESELVHGFLLQDDGPFYPQASEISEARFWSLQEIENNLGKNVFTPNFEQEFSLLKKLLFREEDQRRVE
ncbi:MAG: hypothetical protein Kow0042_17280 [Calditrichia bacterium]